MKVTCLKRDRVVLTLETPDDIRWLEATLRAAHEAGAGSRLSVALADGLAARLDPDKSRHRLAVALETLAEARALQYALLAAGEPLAHELAAAIATAAAFGPVYVNWLRPPPFGLDLRWDAPPPTARAAGRP